MNRITTFPTCLPEDFNFTENTTIDDIPIVRRTDIEAAASRGDAACPVLPPRPVRVIE